MKGDGLLTVGEVTKRTGLSRKALRLYEQAALVIPVTRSDAGYRLYDQSVLPRLDLIRRARALDVGIGELGELLDVAEGHSERGPDDLSALVAQKLAQTQRRIEELQVLERQLSNVAQRLGRDASALSARGSGCGSVLCTCPVTPSRERGGDDMNPTEVKQNAGSSSAGCDCGCECCTPQSDDKLGSREQAKNEQATGEPLATVGGCDCGCGN